MGLILLHRWNTPHLMHHPLCLCLSHHQEEATCHTLDEALTQAIIVGRPRPGFLKIRYCDYFYWKIWKPMVYFVCSCIVYLEIYHIMEYCHFLYIWFYKSQWLFLLGRRNKLYWVFSITVQYILSVNSDIKILLI